MKLLIIALVLANVFLFSSLSMAQEGGQPDTKQKGKMDEEPFNYEDPDVKRSYAIGVSAGTELRDSLDVLVGANVTLHHRAILEGFVDAYKRNPGMDQETFEASMEELSRIAETALKKKMESDETVKNEQLETNLKASLEFLNKNKSKKDIVTLPSGLQYKILKPGTGVSSPTVNDRVKIHYEGKLPDGAVFDSSYERLSPATLGLKASIKGWEEALTLMKKGSKWRIFIPPELGYGETEYENIPPNSVLIFDIELLDIITVS